MFSREILRELSRLDEMVAVLEEKLLSMHSETMSKVLNQELGSVWHSFPPCFSL